MVELNKEQCESLLELIEINLFDIIRNDPDVDSMDWLVDIVGAYKAIKDEVAK